MADLDGREPESMEQGVSRLGVGAEASAPFHPLAACLAAGLIAGLLAFGAGELVYDFFKAELVPTNLMGSISMLPSKATQEVATTRNSVLAYAGLGAALGLALGLAGGLAARSARSARVGGVLGLILGGAVGAGLPFATLPVFFRAEDQLEVDPMIIGLALHALDWGLLGAAAGLAFAFAFAQGGRRRIAHYVFLGFLGAAVGAGIYEALGGLFYPLAKTDQPLATAWQPRFLSRALVSLCVGAAIGLGTAPARRKTAPSAAPAPTA